MGEMHKVEIVVHVDEALGEDQRTELVRDLEKQSGVECAHFTPGREHLLVVDYDRDLIKAMDVLGYVKQEHVGAELIGPI